ncbi:MAG: hypothetical protein KGY68_07085 [Candidatus Thermoplasmatota archaeon]|nr:hypothetical protein [Candidatus Thermoplasmatota archaeon]
MSEIRMVVPDELDKFLESQVRTGTFSSKAELARAALTEYLESISTVSGGYDEETVFSPEGRIYQMEYAREAGYRGKTVIGIEGKEEIVIAADVTSPELGYETEKIMRTDSGLLVSGSGLSLDMLKVIKELENYELNRYKDLKYALTEIFHDHSLSRKLRPLGTMLLIGAKFDDETYLVEVDSSGAHRRMKAGVLGNGKDELEEKLSEKYEEEMDGEKCEGICKDLLKEVDNLQIKKLS